jgi:hypothetical protein
VRVHDGRVCGDGTPEDIVGFRKVDDDDLILLIDLFSYTNKAVGFKRQSLGVRAYGCELWPGGVQ